MTDHHHHHHEHAHEHHHPTGSATPETDKDFAEANRAHFDANAKTAPDPRWIELAKKASKAIRAHYKFDENSTVLMDFACNVGLTSRELAPYTKMLIGVDISQGVVDEFNQSVANQGIAPEEMRAICIELKGEEGELDGLKFDVITCVLSYHHFADIQKITRTLSFFLKPGGALLVVDIVAAPTPVEISEPLFSGFTNVVPHKNGMTKEGIQSAFEGAGLAGFEFESISKVTMHEKEAILFIAKSVKPAT